MMVWSMSLLSQVMMPSLFLIQLFSRTLLVPLDAEDAHIDILSSPIQEAFIHPSVPSHAPLSRYNNKSYPPNAKSPIM
jgi:hypothetical protein